MLPIVENLSHFVPELVLTGAICLAILVSLIFRSRQWLVSYVALAGIIAAGWFVIPQLLQHRSIFSGMVVVDHFSVFFKLVITLATMLIILFSMHSKEILQTVKYQGEYYALILAMTLGMYLTVSASNLLMMVLAIELTGLSSYVLAGFTKEAPDSSEASLKYVIYGALSTGVMLYGISILFGMTGHLGFQEINSVLAMGDFSRITLLIAVILIIVGLGYKISAVPFHFWTPDVYEGAPITITAFLSVASKAAGFAVMIRFFKQVFLDVNVVGLDAGMWASVQNFEWNSILAIVCVLTMTLGNIVAVWQDNLKRMLAYSSIAHAGYMLMGVVLLSDRGLTAVLIYFVMYLFMNLGAFYIVMLVADKIGSEHIDDYKGLGFRAPFMSVGLVIFLFSLTGLPPTAGFVGKLYLFSAVIEAKWIGLAVIGAINSVIALYYYARVVRNLFLRDPVGSSTPVSISGAQMLTILIMLIPTLVFGLYFGDLVALASTSVKMFGVQ